jgi:hypothetical protein
LGMFLSIVLSPLNLSASASSFKKHNACTS